MNASNWICRIYEVYIAVMGVTGAGKSSFISTVSGKKVKVGHALQSCKSFNICRPAEQKANTFFKAPLILRM
jgi:predicted GTPase